MPRYTACVTTVESRSLEAKDLEEATDLFDRLHGNVDDFEVTVEGVELAADHDRAVAESAKDLPE